MSGSLGTIGHAVASSASITLASDGYVIVSYTEDGTSVPTLTCKSDGSATPFGAQQTGTVATSAQAVWVTFVGWITAGTHTIAVSGGSNSFTDIFLTPVLGISNGWFDQAHASYQAAPTTATDALTSGATGTLNRQPNFVVGLSARFTGSSDSAGTGFTLNATTSGTNVSEMVSERLTGYSSTTGKAATFTAVSNTEHQTVVFVFSETAVGGPTISVQPSDQHVASGQTASFSVTASASGGGSLTYQWKINGTNVSTGSGGTTASYTTGTLGDSDDLGSYSCDITEAGGTNDGTTSSSAAIGYVGTRFVIAGSLASSAAAGTTVSPTYPGGIQANDKLRVRLVQKPSAANGGTATTPTGYSLIAQITGATDGNTGGYSATLANNTGNVNEYVFEKDATGSESGTLPITVGTNQMCSAYIEVWRAPSGYSFATTTSTTGKDTSAGSVSITGAGDPGVTAGDAVSCSISIPTPCPTTASLSAEAITQSGVTYSAVAENIQSGSATNNRDGICVWRAKANSGTSSAAPVWTATGGGTTTNIRGPGIFLRLRLTASGGAVAASVTAGASVTAPLTGTGAAASSVTAGASESAALTGNGALAASDAATASVSAIGQRLSLGASSVAAGASESAALTGAGALAAAEAGSAACSAALAGTAACASSVATGATVSATISAASNAALSAGASESAALTGTGAFSCSSSAAASCAATLAGTAACAASTSASATVSATLANSSTQAASLAAGASAAASLTGKGGLAAAETAGASCSGTASGLGVAASACSSSASVAGALAGTAVAQCSGSSSATLSCSLAGSGLLAASCSAAATVTASLQNGATQNATITTATACAGTASGSGALAASCSNSVQVTASLGGLTAAACAAAASAACSGTAGGLAAVVASCAAGATCAGAMAGTGALACGQSTAAACAGTLLNGATQSVSIAGTATIGAVLGAIGALAAPIGAGAALAAGLMGTGACSGAMSAGVTCAGTLGGFSLLGSAIAAQVALAGLALGWAAIGAAISAQAACAGTLDPYCFASLSAGAACSASAGTAGVIAATLAAGASVAADLGDTQPKGAILSAGWEPIAPSFASANWQPVTPTFTSAGFSRS